MKPIKTTTVINHLYARSIRLSEALTVCSELLPDLSPLLKRELELCADKFTEAASKLREVGEVHHEKLIRQGGAQ